MAFEILIKPLVLFDLEDKIQLEESQSAGAGKRFYEQFLNELSNLKHHCPDEVLVYDSVQKYEAENIPCTFFYIVTGATILLTGLL